MESKTLWERLKEASRGNAKKYCHGNKSGNSMAYASFIAGALFGARLYMEYRRERETKEAAYKTEEDFLKELADDGTPQKKT